MDDDRRDGKKEDERGERREERAYLSLTLSTSLMIRKINGDSGSHCLIPLEA